MDKGKKIDVKKILKQGDKKIIIIPKKSNLDIGDYVKFKKLNIMEDF